MSLSPSNNLNCSNNYDTPVKVTKLKTGHTSSPKSGKKNEFKWTPIRRIGLSRKIKPPNNTALTNTPTTPLSNEDKQSAHIEVKDSCSTPSSNPKSKSETFKWTPIRRVGLPKRTLIANNLFQSPKENKSNEELHSNIATPEIEVKHNLKTEKRLKISKTKSNPSCEVLPSSETIPSSQTILSSKSIPSCAAFPLSESIPTNKTVPAVNTIPSSKSSLKSKKAKSKSKFLKIESKKRLKIVLEDIMKNDMIKCADKEHGLMNIFNSQIENNNKIEKLDNQEEVKKKKGIKRKLSLKKSFESLETIDDCLNIDSAINEVVIEQNYASSCDDSKSFKVLQILVENKEKEVEKKLKYLESLKRTQLCVFETNIWKDGCIRILQDLLSNLQMQQFDITMEVLLKKFHIENDILRYNESTNTLY